MHLSQLLHHVTLHGSHVPELNIIDKTYDTVSHPQLNAFLIKAFVITVSRNENLNLGTDVAENISPFTLRIWFAFPYHIYKGFKYFSKKAATIDE